MVQQGQYGEFPFGRPNTARPARMVHGADATVIGVYPSAFHVTWSAPRKLAFGQRRGGVQALAVDVEPEVFWDGAPADFPRLVAEWRRAAGFDEALDGTIAPRSPSTNGSSGATVVRHYLAPLGLDPARTAFTDVYPVFMVKQRGTTRPPRPSTRPEQEPRARRQQGDAIREEYDAIAERLGRRPCSLPTRIPAAELPARAAAEFGARLLEDLERAAAPLVITLGREVWNTLVRVEPLQARPPCATFDELQGHYGAMGRLTVGGQEVEWLPLVHPGLLKGLVPSEQGGRGWDAAHADWQQQPRR